MSKDHLQKEKQQPASSITVEKQKEERLDRQVPVQDPLAMQTEGKKTVAPVEKEEDSKQIVFGESFVDLADQVSLQVRGEMRELNFAAHGVEDGYEEAGEEFAKTLSSVKKESLAKKAQDFRASMEEKANQMNTLLREKELPAVKTALSSPFADQQTKDDVVAEYERKFSAISYYRSLCKNVMGNLSALLDNKDAEAEDLEFFENLLSQETATEGEKDLDELLEEETARMTAVSSMLSGNAPADDDRFVMKQAVVDAICKTEKIEVSVEKTKDMTDFEHNILLSEKFHAAILDRLFQMPAEKKSPQQKQLNELLAVFKKVTDAVKQAGTQTEDAGKEGDAKQQLKERVDIARRSCFIFGAMKQVYMSLREKLQDNADYSFEKQLQVLKSLSAQIPTDGEPANFDAIEKSAQSIVASADVLLQNRHEIGSVSPEDFNFDSALARENARNILKRRKDARKVKKDHDEGNANILVIEEKKAQKRAKEQEIADLERRIQEQRSQIKTTEADKNKGDDELLIRYTNAHEDAYVPQNILGKIKDFTDYNNESVKGVGKMEAFFSRKKLKGADIKVRMNKHVRLFLSNKKGLSYRSVADTAGKIIEGSDILNRYAGNAEVASDKPTYDLIKRLSSAKDADLPEILSKNITEIWPLKNINDELQPDSTYLKNHPQAAKVIALHKLFARVSVNAASSSDQEFKDRLDAAASNVGLLYAAITQSAEYQNALHEQRIEYLQGEVESRRRIIGDLDATIRTAPTSMLDGKEKEIEEQAELHRTMLSGLEGAVETLKRQDEEFKSRIKLELSDEQKRESMKHLQESIDRRRLEALAKRQEAIEFKTEKKEDFQPLKEGAASYIATIIDRDFLDKKKLGYEENSAEATALEEHRAELRTQIVSHLKIRANMFYGGKKLEDFCARELEAFTGAMIERLTVHEGLLKGFISGSEKYREHFLTAALSERSPVQPDYLEKHNSHRKHKVEHVQVVLANCPAYEEKQRYTLRVNELTKARGFSEGMRAVNRLGRMRNLAPFVRKTLHESGILMPMSIYEFRADKIIRNDAADISTETALVNQYKAYIDSCFEGKKSQEIKPPVKFMGDDIKEYGDVANLIKGSYSEFGVGDHEVALVNNLGDDLHTKKKAEYIPLLLTQELRYQDNLMYLKKQGIELTKKQELSIASELYKTYAQEKKKGEKLPLYNDLIKLAKYVQENHYAKDAKTVNANIDLFSNKTRGGRYKYLLPTLMQNEDFKEHLLADSKKEFEFFMVSKTEALEKVTSLLSKHPYVDQYLLERKDDILGYIMAEDPSTINLEEKLNLKALDDEINAKAINIRNGGMGAPKTFGALVDKLITKGLKADSEEALQEKAEISSLFMEVVLQGNSTELLDMDFVNRLNTEYREKKAILTAALDDMLKADNPAIAWPQDMTPEEKIKALGSFRQSFMLNERKNLIYSDVELYRKDVKALVTKDLEIVVKDYNKARELTKANEQKKNYASFVVGQKEKGRKAYISFHTESEQRFEAYCKDEAKTTDVKEEYQRDISQYMEKAKKAMSDDFLSGFYVTAVKRMVVHATADEQTEFLKDIRVFTNLEAFSVAADEYLEHATVGKAGLSATQKNAIKKGLFEVYGERIVTGQEEAEGDKQKNAIETYKKLLTELMEGVDGGFAVTKYIVEDEGGISSIQNGQVSGETFVATTNRAELISNISTLLQKESGTEQLINTISTEFKENEQMLLAHILSENSTLKQLDSLVKEITGNKEKETHLDAYKDAMTKAYIDGTDMTNDLVAPNYKNLLVNLVQRGALKEEVEQACEIVKECMQVKQYGQEFLEKKADKKTQQTLQELAVQMDAAKEATDVYIKDIASNKLLTARDKFWNLYIVMRTYSETFEEYRKNVDSKVIEPNAAFQDIYTVYASLQEYFGVSKNVKESQVKPFMFKLAADLGIMDAELFDPAQHVREDRKEAAEHQITEEQKREALAGKLKKKLVEKTGFKTDRVEKIVDQSEESYPPNVVAAVKKIDRWIAVNALSWKGNSESNFGIEILGHPIRERLFVYYTIEKEKSLNPTVQDVAMSLNAYVPNPEEFEKHMKSWYSFFLKPVGSVKQLGFVKKYGLLDSVGEIHTETLESAVRILDDEAIGVSALLKKMSDFREKAGNQELPEEFRRREACYIELLNEVEKHKQLLKSKKEIKEDDPDIVKQSARISRAFGRYQLANEAVRELLKKPEDESVDETAFDKEADTEIFANEEDSKAQKVWNAVNTVSGLMGSANDTVSSVAEDGIEITKKITLHPLNLSEKQLSNSFKAGVVFQSIDLLDNLMGFVSAYKEAKSDSITSAARVSAAAEVLESGSDLFESGMTMAQMFGAMSEETLESVTEGVGSAVTFIAGTMKTAVDLTQKHTVAKSKDAAMAFAESHKEAEGANANLHVNIVDAVQNTAARQERLYAASATVNGLKAASGLASLLGALIPGVGGVLSVAGTILDVTAKIMSFWKNKEIREQTVDDFLGMDDLYNEYKQDIDQMDENTRKMYGESESDIRATIRKMALREMHFSSMEQFVWDITTQYAKVIYSQIFFDTTGKQITADDQDLIEERTALRNLFPDLAFNYPGHEGGIPEPTAEDMARNMMREV